MYKKVKVIDIHTKKEATNPDRYKNEIQSIFVKEYVYENIDFPLTEEYWHVIDCSFSEIWNNKIGIGGYFYWDEISKQIYSDLQNMKILIEYEKLDKIVNLIITYIENNGGFME